MASRRRWQLGRVASAERRAATEVTPAQQELIRREALRSLAELAGGAAHHLNNLLTIVVGRVQLVLRSTDDERVLRTLTIVEKAARGTAPTWCAASSTFRSCVRCGRLGP